MFGYVLAGVAGFEPTNDGVRVHCLTAWLYPNIIGARPYYRNILSNIVGEIKRFYVVSEKNFNCVFICKIH